MAQAELVAPDQLSSVTNAVLLDCRFSLADPGRGRSDYAAGHIPGAHYLHLDEDLSGSPGKHGGRHPLPDPQAFAARLAGLGVGLTTPVVAYDDARLAFAARLWWLMRSLGYRPPLLLDGGYAGYLASGGPVQTAVPGATPCETTVVGAFSGYCDIDGLRQLQQQGALVIDSREERRYLGLEEPIDPVAGHIPAALSRPWQGVTAADGTVRDVAGQRAHWGDVVEADNLVVYCGSGVTACVNLFSLSLLGRDDAALYAGSWSDWCSHM